MSSDNVPVDTSELRRRYALATGAATAEVHPEDHIFNWLIANPVFDSVDSAVAYYFNDGKNSALKLKQLLGSLSVASQRKSMLEFACGYGCVSRHIVKVMPELELINCDIHPEAIEFLGQNIPGATQLQSKTSPEDFSPERTYDYVFALSFFSHMPRNTWGRWLQRLYSAVSPGGYLLFTTQGEGSRQYHGEPTIPEDGFWYSAQSEQVDLDVNDYGQTIVTPTFVVPEIAKIESARLVGLELRGWWGHQDLYVVRKER